MAIKPWEKIGEPEILVGRYGKYFALQRFINHHGKEVEYGLFGGAKIPSIVLPVTNGGQIVAIRQFRAGANKVMIELPGGNPEHDSESPEQAMTRELLEETGYKAGKIIRLLPEKLYFEASAVIGEFYGFLALDCEKVNSPQTDHSEDIEVITMTFREWFSFIEKEADDTKVSALTIKALPHLGINLIEPRPY